MRAPVLVLCAALLPALARADNTADEADVAFSQGNQAFLKHDYERALGAWFLSYRLVPNNNVLFNIARCYEALDRVDEAYRYYHDLAASGALAGADQDDVGRALKRLEPRLALLEVTSEPDGAEVYIDRRDLGSRGRTPRTLALAPGEHLVMVAREGWRPGEAKVSLERGHLAAQRFALERIVGRVEIDSSTPDAVVRETPDGPDLGRTPAAIQMEPGQKLLFVQAPGYLPAQVLVDVKPDGRVSARVQLVEKPRPVGKVIVTANRDNALVRVDGKDSGFTPVVLTLVQGAHRLEITTEEVAPFVQQLEVAADSETRVHAELHYVPPPVRAASTSQLSLDQAPASVSIITREEIRAFGYQTLPEALQGVRGLFFADDRIYSYVGIRGFSPAGDFNTRVLVLWDGHPINDAWVGQGFAARDLDVDLSEVDRIEVVRGPASLLFGTGALFGVINVVPRDRLGASRHVEGVAGAGGEGGVKLRATGEVGDDKAGAIVSAAGFKSSGADVTDVGALAVRGQDGEQALGATARARWNDLTFTGKINQRVKQVPTAPDPAELGVPGTQYMDERAFAELRFAREVGRLSLDARAGYDAYRYDGTYERTDGVLHELGGGDWLDAELRAGIRLAQGNRLGVSLQGQAQWVYDKPPDETTPRRSRDRQFLSATLLDEWQLHPRIFAQAGVRADKYLDLGDVALSPRAALVLRPYDGGVTKLVAGRAFRVPTPYEQYVNEDGGAPGTLGPEIITTFEIEHTHELARELRLTLAAYHNSIDGLISLVPAGTVYQNSPNTLTATGVEAELRWQPGRFTLVQGSYSYVTLGGEAQASAPAYPTHLGTVRAMLPLKEGLLRLALEATYQSARTDPQGNAAGEALLANVGLSGEHGALRWFAGVRNLLDEQYSVPVASDVGFQTVPQYGRTLWVELAAGF